MIKKIIEKGKGNLEKIELFSLDISVLAFIEDYPYHDIDYISKHALISKKYLESSLSRLTKADYIEKDDIGRFY